MSHLTHELIKPSSVEARLYQEILFTRVLEKGNTLVVAPTALGKTIIAVMLAAHKLKETNLEKKILFLAPTKPLAVQHENSFKKFLQIDENKIVSITGTTKPKEREKIYNEALIINATPQTIENDLLNGLLDLKKFSLVIFDEAHRAVGDYAYVFVSAQLAKRNPGCLILALTASPGSEEEHIQDVCRNLNIKNIEIKDSTDSDVKPYVNEIDVTWVKVDLPPTFIKIKNLLEEYQTKQIKVLKSIGFAVTENKKFYNRIRILEMQSRIRAQLMSHSNTQPSLFIAASKCASMLKIAHAEELIETQGIGALKNYFDKLEDEAAKGKSKAAKSIASDDGIKEAIILTHKLFNEKIQHPKYEELKKIVLHQLRENPKSKIIVFNHYRDSINEVVEFLSKESEIKAKKFIGQATKGKEKGMSQKLQQEVLQELREDKHNVLVASSVAEEGLDIPSVELVVFFEPVPSEIRTIQRRGRTGRFSRGKTIILMARGTRDEAFYWAGRNKEKKMKKTLQEMKKTQMLLSSEIEDKIKNQTKINHTPKFDKEQTLLKTFLEKSEENKNEIIIFADSREGASSVTKKLFDMENVKVISKQLEIGDYILSKDVCVERKTIEDFVSSMIDGRLFTQMVNLRESYPKPLILVEGNFSEIFNIRNIHRNSIIGALTSIALDYQVPIINTKNNEETAEYLYVIAKREQIGKDKEIGIRFGRKGLTTSEKQKFIIEGLPLVGPQLAKNLLEKFGSIKAIIDANEKELTQVEGVGKKKAREIQKIVHSKYEEQEKNENKSEEKNTEEEINLEEDQEELNEEAEEIVGEMKEEKK